MIILNKFKVSVSFLFSISLRSAKISEAFFAHFTMRKITAFYFRTPEKLLSFFAYFASLRETLILQNLLFYKKKANSLRFLASLEMTCQPARNDMPACSK